MCVYVSGMSPYVYAFSFPFELKACGSGSLFRFAFKLYLGESRVDFTLG